jgi:hypothetical protein
MTGIITIDKLYSFHNRLREQLALHHENPDKGEEEAISYITMPEAEITCRLLTQYLEEIEEPLNEHG